MRGYPVALDPHSGNVIWTTAFKDDEFTENTCPIRLRTTGLAAGGSVFYSAAHSSIEAFRDESGLMALSGTTGEIQWIIDSSLSTAVPVLIHQGTVHGMASTPTWSNDRV